MVLPPGWSKSPSMDPLAVHQFYLVVWTNHHSAINQHPSNKLIEITEKRKKKKKNMLKQSRTYRHQSASCSNYFSRFSGLTSLRYLSSLRTSMQQWCRHLALIRWMVNMRRPMLTGSQHWQRSDGGMGYIGLTPIS